MMNKGKRDITIDFMKVIAMVGIMIAHSINVPGVINYLRNFDVILLVILSGTIEGRRDLVERRQYFSNIKRRFVRLFIPTWCFLTILFLTVFVVSKATHRVFPYNWMVILESYTMINGIGYVWIMLVYFFISIGAPIINYYTKSMDKKRLMMFWIIIWSAYEVLRWVVISWMLPMGVVYFVAKEIVLYFISYSLIASVGNVVLNRFSIKEGLAISSVFIVSHFVIQVLHSVISGNFVDLATVKFPPSYIYVSYGLGVAVLLFEGVKLVNPSFHKVVSQFLEFYGRHINWIYFIHVFLIYVWNEIIHINCWYGMFAFLFIGSTIICWCIDAVCLCIEKKVENEVIHSIIRVVWG